MILPKIIGFKREKRIRIKRADEVRDQVRKLMTEDNQKLILMVRG